MSIHSRRLKPGLFWACVFVLAAAARVIYFAYFQKIFDVPFHCSEIPEGSTVLALGFEYAEDERGDIIPGPANTFLAAALAGCEERLARVVTQKAVSDAMELGGMLQEGKLSGKVEVLQMHVHQPGKPVRTFQALEAGLQKLDPLPASLVLLAHDKQVERAASDLHSLYPGQVIVWRVNDVPYQNDRWYTPLRWAAREILGARPRDAFYSFRRWLSGSIPDRSA